MACNPVGWFVFRVIYYSVGIVIGLSVFFCFGKVFHNVSAAAWGFVGGVMAAFCLAQAIYLFIIKEKKRKPPNAVVLMISTTVGALGIAVGLGGIVAYIGVAIIEMINHEPLSLPESSWITCVWCFSVFKWGLTLYLYGMLSFKYLKKVPRVIVKAQDDEDDLIQDEVGDEP